MRLRGIFLRGKIEELRNVFLLTFFLLIITMIFTPLFVRSGFFILSEEIFEAVLIFIQVSVAWNIFRAYEKTVKYRERETQKLELECLRKEKELLEAFKHLGKVNIQVSLIRSFMEKVKAPKSKKELRRHLDEILRIALSVSKRRWVVLRIINTDSLQTVSEFWAKASSNVGTREIKISNKEAIEWSKDVENNKSPSQLTFVSEGLDLFSMRIFLFFSGKHEIDREVRDFLTAVTNQCAIILTLFYLRLQQQERLEC